jgi:hypothetical protein
MGEGGPCQPQGVAYTRMLTNEGNPRRTKDAACTTAPMSTASVVVFILLAVLEQAHDGWLPGSIPNPEAA